MSVDSRNNSSFTGGAVEQLEKAALVRTMAEPTAGNMRRFKLPPQILRLVLLAIAIVGHISSRVRFSSRRPLVNTAGIAAMR